MRYLIALDACVINLFERFAQWFQKWTGYNNFVLAKIAGFLWLAVVGWNLDSQVCEGGLSWNVWFEYGFALFMLLQMGFMHTFEGKMLQRLAEGFGNPDKIDPVLRIGRLLCLFVGADLFIHLITFTLSGHLTTKFVLRSLDIYLFTIFLYLHACDPLPPCSGKLGELLRNMGMRVAKNEA